VSNKVFSAAVALILVSILGLLQYRLWVGSGSWAEVLQLSQAKKVQLDEINRLTERNKALEAEVRDLKKALEAIEERARIEMGMIKKGETFYRYVSPPSADEKAFPPPEKPDPHKSPGKSAKPPTPKPHP
jgi:cell division protein FtsB